MQRYLGELLEALDKYRPKSLTLDELSQKGIPLNTVLDAMDRDLIRAHSRRFEKENVHGKMPFNLTGDGFELLNQIRIKKSIEQLDETIQDFKKSSDIASETMITSIEKLDDSIKRFNESSDKSSKILEIYNARLVNLTLLLVVLTLALLVIPPDTPSSVKYISILFIIGMVLIFFPLKKNQ